MSGLVVLAAAVWGLTAGLAVRLVYPAPARLATRLDLYAAVARSILGRPVDLEALHADRGGIRRWVDRAGAVLAGIREPALLRKLNWAGLLQDLPEDDRARTYRMRQVLLAAGGAAAGFGVAAMAKRSTAMALGLGLVGLVAVVGYSRGRLDRRIEERRDRIRIELYTVNQLLAVRARTGAGVVSAIRSLVHSGRGEVIGELAHALHLHRGGLSAADALRTVAVTTPEPQAARCYRSLALADERGFDLASTLLAFSEDLRRDRRDSMRRRATRRRAAMLLPILGLLGPILILFVAVPLPWIVLRDLG